MPTTTSETRTRIIDYAALVRKQRDYYDKEVPEYEFSNGKKFERAEKRGVYEDEA